MIICRSILLIILYCHLNLTVFTGVVEVCLILTVPPWERISADIVLLNALLLGSIACYPVQ